MTRTQRARANAAFWRTVILPRARVWALVYLAWALDR